MNFLLFAGQFVSYLILMIVIACVAAGGFALGRVLRKSKNAKTAAAGTGASEKGTESK